jgi:ubiquitin-activating enzyme E1
MSEQKEKVAEDLSRMEFTYGARVIGKLKTMRVLIIGMRGLGVEVAKNLILAGPHTVVIHDDEKVAIADLGANFYLRDEHVGAGRASSCLASLVEANPNVHVSQHTGELDEAFLASFHVVVSTDNAPLEELTRRNGIVRVNGKFIYANTNGVFNTVFTDFNEHMVFDADGVPEHTVVLERIVAKAGETSVVEIDTQAANLHGFHDGDLVRITDVSSSENKDGSGGAEDTEAIPIEGASNSFNGLFVMKDHKVEYKTTDSKGVERTRTKTVATKFQIADCSGAGTYTGGGMATLVKPETKFTYQSLAEQADEPTMEAAYADFNNFGLNYKLHYARLGLWAFQSKHNGELPGLHNKADAKEVVEEVKAIFERHKAEGKEHAGTLEMMLGGFGDAFWPQVEQCALYSRTELTAFCALFGGVVAQEVVKFTGKYTPLKQWIHASNFELLQTHVPIDAIPAGSRYDHQISVFGKAVQARIGKARLFLVGCGALGCEFLKGIAMSGYGCAGGIVHVTDMDTIELSNLSRQFLFRHRHINQLKSVAASDVVVEMNRELKSALNTHTTKVAPDTENKFTADFWDSLDFVVNALDNIQARQYMDGRCVLHSLPLFESGTLGTQANSVLCFPHLSKSYSEGATAGEGKGIAQCTLKNFPSLPLHCIEYAKEKFEDTFTGGAQKVKDFLEDPAGFLTRNESEGLGEHKSLLTLQKWLDICRNVTLSTCVQMALDQFVQRYVYAIQDLQTAYPEDAVETEKSTGVVIGPFWHGHKRFPRVQTADVTSNPAFVNYLYHTACIYAASFGLPEPTQAQVAEVASTLTPVAYSQGTVNITDEDDTKEEVGDDFAQTAALKATLLAIDVKQYANTVILPTDFEKDDDTNHHIDWITSSAGLRAWNYFIEQPDKKECRRVAGNIIPAIATTTACVTGYIQVEMLKYIIGAHADDFRQVTFDLSVNSYVLESLPDPNWNKTEEGKLICRPEGFTTWDILTIVSPDVTVADFLALLGRRINAQVTCVHKAGCKQLMYQQCDISERKYKDAKKKLKRSKNPQLRALQEQIIAEFEGAAGAKEAMMKDLYIRTYCADAGEIVGANFMVLSVLAYTEDGISVKVPKIKFVLEETAVEDATPSN